MAKAKGSDIDVKHTWNPNKKLPDPPKDPSKERRWVTERNFKGRIWSGWKPVEPNGDVVTEAYGNKLVEMPKDMYKAKKKAEQERHNRRKKVPGEEGLTGETHITRDGKTVLKED